MALSTGELSVENWRGTGCLIGIYLPRSLTLKLAQELANLARIPIKIESNGIVTFLDHYGDDGKELAHEFVRLLREQGGGECPRGAVAPVALGPEITVVPALKAYFVPETKKD